MLKAVVKGGEIRPLEPLPADWHDGQPLRVDKADDCEMTHDEIDRDFALLTKMCETSEPEDEEHREKQQPEKKERYPNENCRTRPHHSLLPLNRRSVPNRYQHDHLQDQDQQQRPPARPSLPALKVLRCIRHRVATLIAHLVGSTDLFCSDRRKINQPHLPGAAWCGSTGAAGVSLGGPGCKHFRWFRDALFIY